MQKQLNKKARASLMHQLLSNSLIPTALVSIQAQLETIMVPFARGQKKMLKKLWLRSMLLLLLLLFLLLVLVLVVLQARTSSYGNGTRRSSLGFNKSPHIPRSNRAIRPPLLTQLVHLRRPRQVLKVVEKLNTFPHTEVVDRENIGSVERKDHEHVNRPRANPIDHGNWPFGQKPQSGEAVGALGRERFRERRHFRHRKAR
ncbi:hypothetical protein CR513_04385, partial [Mucuna pruriens]